MTPLALVLALVAQVQAPGPEHREAPAVPAVARPKPGAGEQVVCHPGVGTGRILGPPVCRTRDQWEAMARVATSGLDHGPPSPCRPGMMTGC